MRNNKGFTLVELLAVIVILAIIMIISIPAVLDTMVSARRKTFGEYVTKVYSVAQKKYMNDEMLGNSKSYAKYNIKTDLDLGSTGNFEGYVAIKKNVDNLEIYVSITDGEYHTATKYGEDDSMVVNYINYTFGGEPTYSGNLGIYDGKKNYFISGPIDNFDLPDEPSVENGNAPVSIPISSENYENIGTVTKTPEDKFVSGALDFLSKVRARFNVDLNDSSSKHRFDYNEYVDDSNELNVTVKEFQYAYKISDIYENTDKNGYAIIFGKIYFGTPEGDLPDFDTYFAYKDENYHTILRVYGTDSKTREKITETLPIVQISSHYKNGNLQLKRITTLPTLYLGSEFEKNAVTFGVPEAEASGDYVAMFKANGLAFNQTMNSAHYYCSNTNASCSLQDNYYDFDYVAANMPFSIDIDF